MVKAANPDKTSNGKRGTKKKVLGPRERAQKPDVKHGRASNAQRAQKPRKNDRKSGKMDPAADDIIQGRVLSDEIVAAALGDILRRSTEDMRQIMQKWAKPILKVPIPGVAGRVPSKAMLEAAKMTVIRFFQRQAVHEDRSDVVKAFYLASRERHLVFDWGQAMKRVSRARLDRRRKIDSWKECLAMASGDTNAESEIFICGTRPVTLRALTSLICHEALHNLARRTRRGNPYLGEETEHVAMALLGDPQLSA